MENNVVEMKNGENVNNEPEKVADVQQPIEGKVEGEGTPNDGDPISPAADDIQPTFKEKFVNGAKAVGRGAKRAAKAVKPYAVGAAIGIGTAMYAGFKIYKAVKAGEGNTELGKSDTPLLTADDTEMNYLDNVGEVSDVTGEFEATEVDVPEVSTDLDIEL